MNLNLIFFLIAICALVGFSSIIFSKLEKNNNYGRGALQSFREYAFIYKNESD